jgi:diguanylate cyclase (GGDEF)-like protein/PAS domain S-box-containing protein
MGGLFVSQPIDRPSSVDFMILAAILFISVLAIDLLVSNMRKTLALARAEILRRKQTEAALREKEVQYRALADSGIALIWMSGTDKLCNYFNIPWLKFTGRTLAQELGNGWAEGVHPDDFDRCLATFNAAFDKHETFDMDYRLRHVSGEFRWIQDLGTPNYNSNGEFIGYIGHCFDITARKQAEDKFRMLFELSPIGLAMVDNITGEFLEVNEAILHATGYTKDEFLKLSYWDITPREYEAQEMKQLQELKETGRFGPDEKEFIRKDGTRYPLSISGALFVDQTGKQIVWGIIEDITERKQAEEQLRYQGTHDALTGIYNRTFFEVELARLEHSRDFPISIVVADVDRLKFVNDTRGHALGDQLLRHVANVLSSVFREGDVLARIGGDEFAVLLPATQTSTAEEMLARVRERVAQQNSDYPDLPVQLSLGMATAEKSSLTAAFTLADQRMYADKAERAAAARTHKL